MTAKEPQETSTGGSSANRGLAELKFEFAEIVPGEFTMGGSDEDAAAFEDEMPAHRIRITRGFEMQRYLVTQSLWTAVMDAPAPGMFHGKNRPVECVSWYEVQEFMGRLNKRRDGFEYRLPTEAEWEYVCSCGTESRSSGPLGSVAWYWDNSDRESHPVGLKTPNLWGFYDMLGNLHEWCLDRYGEDYYSYSPNEDPSGPVLGEDRVVRGGCWQSFEWLVRPSTRGKCRPEFRNSMIGFRCLRRPA